jgi:hypothetical protein
MASDAHDRPQAVAPGFDLDLVEYLVIAVPDLADVAGVAEALRRLVLTGRIQILDLVGVVTSLDGGDLVLEPEVVSGMSVLRDVEGEVGGLLTDDDIALACSELPWGTAAVVLVVEDRWADVLASAARTSGGRIVGGERIPRHRVAASLGGRRSGGAVEMAPDATRSGS